MAASLEQGPQNTPDVRGVTAEARERELEGQVWLVTGASRANGIGAAIARLAGRRGARLSLSATQASTPEAFQLVSDLKSEGIEAIWTPADLTEKHTGEELVAKTIDQYGRLDALVNNAGKTYDMFFTATTGEDWLAGFGVNLQQEDPDSRPKLSPFQ